MLSTIYTYLLCLHFLLENGVQHLITTVWRADGVNENPPKLPTVVTRSDDICRILIDECTEVQDSILVDVNGSGKYYISMNTYSICVDNKLR